MSSVKTPPVDIYEDRESYLLLVDMPGVSAETLSVEVDREELRVSGENGVAYGRRFRLPRGMNVDQAEARLEDGVLTVRLAKPASEVPRRIAIQTG